MTRRPLLLTLALLGALLLPLPAFAEVHGLVVANGLRLRSEPNGRQLGTLQHGEIVTVHAKRGNWLGVRSAAGQRGWVFSRYVRPVQLVARGASSVPASAPRATASAPRAAASAPRGETARTTAGLRLRPSPGTSGEPLAIVPEGATVEVIGRDGNWRKVKWNGRTGWLYSDYLRPQSGGERAHGHDHAGASAGTSTSERRGAAGALEGPPADPAPTSGRIDTTNLSSLHPTLRAKVERILRRLQAKGWQPYVAEGKRTRAQQAEKVRLGYSQTMNSHHLTGRAADIVDRRYGWSGRAADHNFQFWRDLGEAARAEGLTWGGDWRSFKDVAHVQL